MVRHPPRSHEEDQVRGQQSTVEVRRSQGRRCRVRRTLPLLAVPLVVAFTGALAAPASAAGNGKFSIVPYSTSSQGPTYFSPVLQAGVPVKSSVVVVNETTKPLTLDLYAADAFTTRSGEFALQPNFKPKRAMGAWIHLPLSKVTVPARSGSVVPFTYDPPQTVRPGDYAGGIVAEATAGKLSNRGSLRLQALDAVGTAVYGRIQGPLHPRLAVTSVSISTSRPLVSQFGGAVDATVHYSITNTGNENLDPAVTISLSPLIGGGPTPVHLHLPQVLPGSTVTLSHTFDDVTPFGSLSATVASRALGAVGSGSTSTVIVPWGVVAVLLLVLLLVLLRRWRRNKRRAPASGGIRPDPEPADGSTGALAISGSSRARSP